MEQSERVTKQYTITPASGKRLIAKSLLMIPDITEALVNRTIVIVAGKHPEVKNNSLFAYLIVLIKRLPEKEYRASLILELEKLLEEYKDDIDLRYMVFPQNYKTIWENILDRL